MPVDVVVMSQAGEKVADLPDILAMFDLVDRGDEARAKGWEWLHLVDPYGLTYANYLQIPPIVRDVQRIRDRVKLSNEELSFLARFEEKARYVERTRSLLVFTGD